MRRFAYFAPATIQDAVDLLARFGSRASVLAGGTDLLVEIKEQLRHPDCVVNIKRVSGMDTLSFDPHTGLHIGALVTARTVEVSPDVRDRYSGLLQATRELGSIQVRNRATIAGNVCRASPSADTLPPLLADGAKAIAYGPAGTREIALEEFFKGPGMTALATDEILIAVHIPPPSARCGKVYIKHGRRKAMELATVGVAVTLSLDESVDEPVARDVRIVLGAVAPTPIRALQAESLLRGRPITPALIAAAAARARAEARPISNVRASASYRSEMVEVLTRRAITEAQERAR